MNLLTDPWIPIQTLGLQKKITLQQLLCDEIQGEICLPRDDMEFACLQLLVAIVQVLFKPKNKKELVKYIKQPLTKGAYIDACENKLTWFDLNHAETPFMQHRGVTAKSPTKLDKLLAGVADGTNKVFINPTNLVKELCHGCAAIALYNTAYNCPSSGGGFKAGMRGSTPISVLIRSTTLRQTIWHNVLTQESITELMPWHSQTSSQSPSYVETIKPKESIASSNIGLDRGLLWQPAHVELCGERELGTCSLCGCNEPTYTGFNKEKFNFAVTGVWPHPLTGRALVTKKNGIEEKFLSFTTTQPTWVHLGKCVLDLNKGKEGSQSAPVIKQLKTFGAKRLKLLIGGYRNNQATILERRHELLSLADGWHKSPEVIDTIIALGLDYKKALRKALYLFGEGVKERFSGSGINVTEQYDALFFQQTEEIMYESLASFSFENAPQQLLLLSVDLKLVTEQLFNQAVAPYQQEPKMLAALASSRRLLHKYLKELEPQGGLDGR